MTLRIALLTGPEVDAARRLQTALETYGDQAEVLSSRGWPSIERRLSRRGYEPGLTRVLSLYRSLMRSGPQLVHAFGLVEAAAGAGWARRAGCPAVLSLGGPLDRSWIIERRLRLPLLLRAAEQCQAILVPSDRCAERLRRELGLDAVQIDHADGPGHHALYERLTEADQRK